MKKNLYKIRFTLALFVAMLFGATNVQAQTTYDLWIWGTQVTEANCGNLAPLADATEGTMTYSNSTKTLTLDNVKIDKSGSINSINIIRSSIDGLKIEVVGENELKNNGWSLIDINKNTTIQGSGTLNIVNTNSDNFGIYVSASATLTIKDCNVNIISPGGAIHGLNNESLVFDNAFVKAKGSKNGSIYGFANITFTNCVISKPAGAKVYNRAICYADGSRIKDTVKIIPPYNLKIWDTPVTEDNCGDLAPLAGVTSGAMTYNNSTKTLTLDNVNIDKSASTNFINIIRSSIDGLKIEVVGENNLKNNGWSLIDIDKNTTIQGSGTLNIENTRIHDCVINATTSATLTIKDCKVNITCSGGGIRGDSNGDIVFDNAFVTAKGTNSGSIYGFKNITFVDCGIAKPVGAKVYNKAICDAGGNIIKDTVKILPGSYYALWIWDTPVTEDNCGNLAAVAGATDGTMTYNNSTKTLTIDNLKIDTVGNKNIIKSCIDGLKIEVIGENSLKNNGWSLIDVESNTTIQGSGILNIENSSNDIGININVSDTLKIKDCYLNVTCPGNGIRGGGNAYLIFDNATVTARGTNSGSIVGFKNITFVDCGIAKPTGAVFNTLKKAICDVEGNIIKDTVKIELGIVNNYYDLWIWGKQVTEDNCGDLATVAGASEGSITYNNLTKTLKLENVKIDRTGNKNIIRSSIDGLKIEVVGKNNLKNHGWSLIDIDKNTTIQGNDTLNIENTNYDFGINVAVSATLTIKDCHLNITTPNVGFRAWENESLVFDNATVAAKGSSGSIVGFKNITFVNCGIAKPTGAVFNIWEKAICDVEGNIIKDTVKILPGIVNNYYNLLIWNTQVTEDNCGDLATAAGASEGSITYNNLTKTLKLENVKIDRTGNKNIIRSSIDGLKIEVVGKNNLKNHGWSLIDVSKNTTIQGSDTLNIQNTQNNLGINITASANLTIKDCHLNVTSVGAGIRGWTNESLIFDNATVKVRGSGEGSIFEFKEINLNNTFISKPDGAKITNGKITNAGGEIIKDTVKIEPIIGYDLWICGTQVTNANKNNLSVIDGVTGTVKYNPTTTTLTLDNADISCTTTSGISSEVDGLKIYLIGNNIIANNGNSSTISLVANSNIVGSGTLDVINAATNGGAIYANNCTLLISNCTVNAIGGANGIRGTSNNTLIIEKATVSAIGNTEGSIMDFKIITFTNCVISKPVGAVFNNSIRAICNTLGNIITDTVKIVPAYDLWICGTQITDANKDDLTVINGVTGTAKYNTTTKILTLNNADISCTTTPGISSEIDELKIDLIGNNTIANNGTSSTVSLFANGKIMGSGTLDVVNAATNGCAIYANNCSLLISNCTVNATGGANGIKGTSNNAITFDKAAVSAIGNVEGSIMGFETITFTNCAISKPTGAVFNGTIKAICDTLGNIIKDTVRIAPVYDLWICGTQVTTS